MSAALVSVIGPPGCGKTTLAEGLCADLNGELIRETFAENPFLAESYAGAPESRLPAQLHFLISRVAQLSLFTWPGQGLYISDYGFCQDRLYASRRLLDDDYRALYEPLVRRLEGLVRPPDVLIVLDAPEAVLLERIARRGRGYEKVMTAEFLRDMRSAYHDIRRVSDAPVLAVRTDETDLRRPEARAGLGAEVLKMLDRDDREEP